MHFIFYLIIKYISIHIYFHLNYLFYNLSSTPLPSARPTKVEIKYLCNALPGQRHTQWQRQLVARFVAELWGLQRQYPQIGLCCIAFGTWYKKLAHNRHDSRLTAVCKGQRGLKRGDRTRTNPSFKWQARHMHWHRKTGSTGICILWRL